MLLSFISHFAVLKDMHCWNLTFARCLESNRAPTQLISKGKEKQDFIVKS